MNPATTALVMIEFQNDFTSEGGALHGAVQDSMAATGMLDHARKALHAARAACRALRAWSSMPVAAIESWTAPCSAPPSLVKSFWNSIMTSAVVAGFIGAPLLDVLGRTCSQKVQVR